MKYGKGEDDHACTFYHGYDVPFHVGAVIGGDERFQVARF